MKELFVNNTGKHIMEDMGFFIVDTSTIYGSIINYTFLKEKWGALHMINFVDADVINFSNSDDIENILNNELIVFKQASGARAIIYFKIFVTEYGLSKEVQDNILKYYNHSLVNRASLVPVIINLREGRITLDSAMDKIGLSKLLEDSLKLMSQYDKYYNLEDVQNYIKKDYGYNAFDSVSSSLKPYVTYILIAVNILVFAASTLVGGLENPDVLVRFGAKINSLVLKGEYWRLLTSAFLHAGLAHLVFNMYGLYNIGSIVEKVYGHGKFVVIYMFSALTGGIGSLIFSPFPSVGASGAIFGLFGALIYLGRRKPKLFSTSFGINIIIVLGFNLLYGFSNTGIDNYAHIGGLIGGYLSSGITRLKTK